jgi:hypothetical protein
MAKVIVQHKVADYDAWLAVFNGHETVRRQHGATGHSVSRDPNDPSSIVIVNDFASVEGAVGFSKDPSLPEAMAKGGVIGHPTVFLVDEADVKAY